MGHKVCRSEIVARHAVHVNAIASAKAVALPRESR
jgi:hypothetical protein